MLLLVFQCTIYCSFSNVMKQVWSLWLQNRYAVLYWSGGLKTLSISVIGISAKSVQVQEQHNESSLLLLPGD